MEVEEAVVHLKGVIVSEGSEEYFSPPSLWQGEFVGYKAGLMYISCMSR